MEKEKKQKFGCGDCGKTHHLDREMINTFKKEEEKELLNSLRENLIVYTRKYLKELPEDAKWYILEKEGFHHFKAEFKASHPNILALFERVGSIYALVHFFGITKEELEGKE